MHFYYQKEYHCLYLNNEEKMAHALLLLLLRPLCIDFQNIYIFLFVGNLSPLCILLINVGGELNYHNSSASLLH